jgi:hypothetical protein
VAAAGKFDLYQLRSTAGHGRTTGGAARGFKRPGGQSIENVVVFEDVEKRVSC